MCHIFSNLFELDLEDKEDSKEEDSISMTFLSGIDTNHGIDSIVLLTCEDYRSTCLSLSIRLAVKVKSLQFYLKCLQEKGMFSINSSFDQSSIYESAFRKFNNYPISIWHIISEMGTQTIPPTSIKFILKDVLSDNKLDFKVSKSSDINNDSASFTSTHEESDSFLD